MRRGQGEKGVEVSHSGEENDDSHKGKQKDQKNVCSQMCSLYTILFL